MFIFSVVSEYAKRTTLSKTTSESIALELSGHVMDDGMFHFLRVYSHGPTCATILLQQLLKRTRASLNAHTKVNCVKLHQRTNDRGTGIAIDFCKFNAANGIDCSC